MHISPKMLMKLKKDEKTGLGIMKLSHIYEVIASKK